MRSASHTRAFPKGAHFLVYAREPAAVLRSSAAVTDACRGPSTFRIDFCSSFFVTQRSFNIFSNSPRGNLQALVAPLSGGAAAARAALLGARNALEPERYEDRRLAQ